MKMKEIISKLLQIYRTYKTPILYILFGGLTTLVNILVYSLCYYIFLIDNVPSNIIAWVISVAFAYITNRIYVFESKSKSILYEIFTFFACRAGTGLLDTAIMYVTVDLLSLNNIIMKVIANIIVILLNYIFSKVIIFKK